MSRGSAALAVARMTAISEVKGFRIEDVPTARTGTESGRCRHNSSVGAPSNMLGGPAGTELIPEMAKVPSSGEALVPPIVVIGHGLGKDTTTARPHGGRCLRQWASA
jgi:hypothetical protein